MTHFYRSPLHLGLTGLALFSVLGACGQPSVDADEGTRLVAPTAPQATLSLAGAQDGVSTYTGALVLWDDALVDADLTSLLNATRRFNALQVEAERAFNGYLARTFQPRKATIEAKEKELEVLRVADDASVDARQGELAASWFDSELASVLSLPEAAQLGDEGKAATRAHVEAVFQKYCEAKVWEYGFNPILARETFVKRPTPNALCESVYAAKGFFTGASCSDVAAGRNYYACIWTEGIAKTSFYAKLGADARARLASTMASDTARQYVSGEKSGVAACAFSSIRTNALTMAKGPTPAARNLKALRCSDITSTPIALKMVALDAAGGEVDVTTLETSLETSTPAGVDGVFGQGAACLAGSDLCVVPAAVAVSAGSVSVPTAVASGLEAQRQRAAAFMKDLGGCDAALKSPNDAFFNAARLVNKSVQGCPKPEDISTLPDTFAKPDPRISLLRKDIATLNATLYADEANMCPKQGLDDCNKGDTSTQCRLRKLTDEKFNAVFKPGVSQATFREFTVRIEGSGNAQRVVLSFGKGDVAATCLQTEGAAPVKGCGVTADLAKAGLKASFEPTTRRLVMTLPIDLDVFLNGYLGKNGAFLVSSDEKEVGGIRKSAGKTLWMEVFPSQLDGQRPYLSGKALVKSGDTELAQGTVSYLLDMRFDETLGAFCSAVRNASPLLAN
ncbi:MAG: hypothetical protein IOD12_18070 [Silvanigrellales bacterium]|nr:hypothetical protein [Silvanigrellales bacterium]